MIQVARSFELRRSGQYVLRSSSSGLLRFTSRHLAKITACSIVLRDFAPPLAALSVSMDIPKSCTSSTSLGANKTSFLFAVSSPTSGVPLQQSSSSSAADLDFVSKTICAFGSICTAYRVCHHRSNRKTIDRQIHANILNRKVFIKELFN